MDAIPGTHEANWSGGFSARHHWRTVARFCSVPVARYDSARLVWTTRGGCEIFSLMDAPSAPSQATDPILARMHRLGIREEDLDETFVRSGGHGGQNVNKIATCVMLVHRPTGIAVKCQETRYQGRNRELARILFLSAHSLLGLAPGEAGS